MAQNLKQSYEKQSEIASKIDGRQRPRKDNLKNLRTDPELIEKLPILDELQSQVGTSATNPLTILKKRGPTKKTGLYPW